MAKLRSPILGYNHNVRYRGLVLHVQTEDSGITNPHVFTHLFHGGVILTTRKLVYDADASEETVKSLMQSQHKAVLRDLKRGLFDDKIDAYLGGTPGLLPRGQGVDAEIAPAAAPVTPPPGVVQPPPLEEPEPELTLEPALPVAPPQPRTMTPVSVPGPASIAIPAPGRSTGRHAQVQDTLEARAPTERFSSDMQPPPPRTTAARPGQAMTPPPPVVARPAERGVSAAFDAIMAGDERASGGGGLAEVPGEDAVIEIRSEAPGSPPPPPGMSERPGSYAQHRRRGESGAYPVVAAPPPPPPVPTGPPARPTPRPSTPAPGPLARPPTPMSRPSGPPPRASTGPLPTYPSGRPTSPVPRAQTQARTRSPNSGGVVVTRPAVIIGAPSRTVGGTGPQAPMSSQHQPAPAAAQAQPGPPQRPSTTRARKAREDSESGLFGQDLISEKSLDEVILAYLSEDPAEE